MSDTGIYKIVRAKLMLDVAVELNDNQATPESVKYLVEQDLEDLGYDVYQARLVSTEDAADDESRV